MTRANTDKKHLTVFRTCLFAFLCIAMLALGVRFTVAAFTANDFLKAVATTNQNDSMFASDVLAGYTRVPGDDELDANRQSQVLGDKGDSASFNVEIYNHLQGSNDVVNPKDVTYDFSVEVQGVTNLTGYSVSRKGETTKASGNTFTIEGQFLKGNTAQTHTFTMTMPTADIGQASFVIKAVARTGSGTNLWGLARKVVPARAATVETASVTGQLNTAASVDAYNYEITVTGKAATVTLTWNSNEVEIEPFFEEKYGANPGSNSVTFMLQPGVTTINFYQVNGFTGSPSIGLSSS